MATTTAEKATRNSNGKAEPQYDDLSREVAQLKKDISSLTETLSALGRTEVERATKRAGEARDRVAEKGRDSARAASEMAEGYLREGERFVREDPAKAVGIAAAIGFLLGFLFHGRR